MIVKAKKTFALCRIKKGYSITRLAEEMQVNPSVVSKMEKQQPVRPATARKACIALNESFEILFTIENQEVKEHE